MGGEDQCYLRSCTCVYVGEGEGVNVASVHICMLCWGINITCVHVHVYVLRGNVAAVHINVYVLGGNVANVHINVYVLEKEGTMLPLLVSMCIY